MMDRILDKVVKADKAADIYIVSNSRFFGNFERWQTASAHRARVSLINDGTGSNETRLGAVNDIMLVITQAAIDEDLLVIAADNLFEFNLASFLNFARKHSDGVAVALYDIRDVDAAKKFGIVKIDEASRVVSFQEKPANPESTLASTGIYYIPREKLALLKEYSAGQGQKLDAPGYFISWLTTVDRVYGFKFSEDWYDIGDIETYRKVDATYTKKEN
jgi:glucose-1-phosphate thymidylyltransferase